MAFRPLLSRHLLFSQAAASVGSSTQVAAIVQTNPEENIVRAGSEVMLAVREELTTKKKKLRVGQRFQMEVASDVITNGVTVIPAGTPAIGEITESATKGCGANPATLERAWFHCASGTVTFA